MNTNNKPIIVRLAPSPTGNLHIGTARTGLFNALFARHFGGKFILRIEDTDKERSKKEYEENILEGLKWLGISFDEFYRQSERGEVYKKHLEHLLSSDVAYVSKEEKTDEEGDGKEKRSEVIRFRNPGKKIIFLDIIRGDIEFDTTELGDFVIAKDLESPLYHFAVVVDDFEMNVTHIIRGEDHISNTPRQILIQEALGAPRPEYAHIPLILAPDRTKLSKRHGAVALTEYRNEGYLSEALINYLALLGWNPGSEQEVFSSDEIAQQFSLEKIQKGGAIFDKEKLNWFNREHLLKLSLEEREEGIEMFLPPHIKELAKKEREVFQRAVPVLMERIHTFGDVVNLAADGEVEYFFEDPKLDRTKILPQKASPEGGGVDNSKRHLKHVIETLSNIPPEAASFTAEATKSALWDYATTEGRGNVLWPMRYSLTGRDKSPDPFTVASVIGKDVTLRRLEKALAVLSLDS